MTGTDFLEQLVMLRVVPTTLYKATDPLDWSCDIKCCWYNTQHCMLLQKVSSSN